MIKNSKLLEECLPGILLNASEKLYFEHLIETNEPKPIQTFFENIETRYLDVKKHNVELKNIERLFKKKTINEELGRRYETLTGSHGGHNISRQKIMLYKDNINVEIQSNNDVLIELYDENNNLQDSVIKSFDSEEAAKLFVQQFYTKNSFN